MIRSFLAFLVFAGSVQVAQAQEAASVNKYLSPFSSLSFANSYKDTVTLNVTYLGQSGDVVADNTVTLSQIKKLHGLNVSRFKGAMAFVIPGFAQKFYIPYSNDNRAVIAATQANTLLTLKCVVYRFFTIDGITNFFCVDKVKVN